MTVLSQRTYINGPHTLKVINSLSSNSPEANVATATTVGCMEEGFTLSWQGAGEEFKAECSGETPMDEVFLGIQKVSLEFVLTEFDANRTIIEQIVWPWRKDGVAGDGTGFGSLENVGRMVMYGGAGTPGSLSTIFVAEPVVGTAPATNTVRWYFYAAYPDVDETFSLNFNNKMQALPCTFKLFPVINEDDITAGTSGNRIYYPDDDVSGLTLAEHTYRFFRRLPTS
jgi:hypothetical protein